MINPQEAGAPGWQAFMDESESDRMADPNTYVLASVLLEPSAMETSRQALQQLLEPGQRKLHWRAESARRQARIIDVLASLDVLHVIVVRDGIDGEPSERRRRKCLERMAFELDSRGVVRFVAESREAKQNARDMKVFNVLRSTQTISPGIRLYHEPGPAEPLLWIADAVAGAYTASRIGSPANFKRIEPCVDLVELTAEG